jgi:hypothetical protein
VETVTADRWITARLRNDATLMGLVTKVHQWPVPANAVLPYVLFQEQSAVDLEVLGGERVWVDGLWLVRAVAETRDWGGALEQAANRIDALLHKAAGPATGGNVWACRRVRPFRLTEDRESGQFRHLGGLYRLYVK